MESLCGHYAIFEWISVKVSYEYSPLMALFCLDISYIVSTALSIQESILFTLVEFAP